MKNRLFRILFTLSIITTYNTTIFGASEPSDKENQDKYAAFIHAARTATGETKNIFIEAGADLALTYAKTSQTEKLQASIDAGFIDVNLQYKDQTTLLGHAAQSGNLGTVKILLDAQANPNHQGITFGITPLMIASKKNNKDIVELLLTNNANPNLSSKGNLTAFLVAADQGHIDTIEIFLKHGLNINNQESPLKESMLMLAAQAGHFQLVKYLIDKKADISLIDQHGNNAFTNAVATNNRPIAEKLFNAGKKTKKPFSLFTENNSRKTALMLAVQNGTTEILAFLLEKITTSDDLVKRHIARALSQAVCQDFVDAAKILLAKSPIHQEDAQLLYAYAIKNNFTQIAQLLEFHLPRKSETPTNADQTVTCSGPGCDKEGPQKCGQCATVSYCSKECQTAHWKTGGHKAVCLSLAGKPSVASKQQEQNSQTVLTQSTAKDEKQPRSLRLESKADDSDSKAREVALLASNQQKIADQNAIKAQNSKTLVTALEGFNRGDNKTHQQLRRLIEQGHILYGADKTEKNQKKYNDAEAILFPPAQVAHRRTVANHAADAPTKQEHKQKRKKGGGKAAQQSDAQDTQLRAEKDRKLKQLALEQRYGVQPNGRAEWPKQRPEDPYYWPQQTANLLPRDSLSGNLYSSNAPQPAGSNIEQATGTTEKNRYLAIPYGQETLQLNMQHLFDGEVG
ncbi:MAG: ankyrin repeat and MYND domain-containing protein, partial [Candidatus Dependentiae bacterium]|nr:ankyrin repeat and MYND domain-containing protein [Candidatus Dependentiae bacterium]